jgi:FkbM family methyltransferase
MNYQRQKDLPYPQPWEWIKDNIDFSDDDFFYVDVGANDGLIVSNTAYFDLVLKWKGICIEPHPGAFSELIKNRTNSINLNICISDEEGEVDFCAVSGYAEMLSGIEKCYHPDHKKRIESEIEKHGGNKEILKIISKPLRQVLSENKVKKVDYLSIDTEGSELQILKSIDFDIVDIRVISTENSSKSDIKTFLESKGFIFSGVVCCDEIYYKK